MIYMLSDGWRDESTEGPYTEVLQTKYVDGNVYTIVKLFDQVEYVLKINSIVLDTSFHTLESAKEAAENYIVNTKEPKKCLA